MCLTIRFVLRASPEAICLGLRAYNVPADARRVHKRSFEFYLLRDAKDEIMGKWVETFLVYSTQRSSTEWLFNTGCCSTSPRFSLIFHIFQLPRSNPDWSSICRYFVSVAFILVHIFHNVLWLRSSWKHMKLICKQMVVVHGWRHGTESSAD